MLSDPLLNDIPLIKRYIRTHGGSCVVAYEPGNGTSISFHENNILIADSTLFDAFTFTTLSGDLSAALDIPTTSYLQNQHGISILAMKMR